MLLDFPAPVLPAYSRESVVAEKFQAMVMLGIANSRMKDFYDLWVLARQFEFQGPMLCQAIRATFERRRTPVPAEVPLALSPSSSRTERKQAQWRAFVGKGKLDTGGAGLDEIVDAAGLPDAPGKGRRHRWAAGDGVACCGAVAAASTGFGGVSPSARPPPAAECQATQTARRQDQVKGKERTGTSSLFLPPPRRSSCFRTS